MLKSIKTKNFIIFFLTEVPFINFKLRENDNWVERDTDYFFADKEVLLLSLPGAFTPI